MKAVTQRTSRGKENAQKVDTKTRKAGGETRTAAQGTVMRKKARDGHGPLERGSGCPSRTRGQTLKKRRGKIGKLQMVRARMTALQTEMRGCEQQKKPLTN